MDDEKIIELFWNRNENALYETADKYGRYCHYIAFCVLHNDEDSEECVDDVYMKAWESIPPKRPASLKTFLGKVTRHIAINKYRYLTAEKRNAGQIPLVLDELSDCLPSEVNVENAVDEIALAEIINIFLAELPVESRKIFVRRYWYLNSIKEIADGYGYSESKVKMSLSRSRNALKKILEKEGFTL